MLVPLESIEGKKRLEEACAAFNRRSSFYNSNEHSNEHSNEYSNVNDDGNRDCKSAVQHETIESFRQQRGNTACGLASLAVLLTARGRSLSLPPLPPCASPAAIANGPVPFFVDEDDVYPMAVVLGHRSNTGASRSGNRAAGAAPFVADSTNNNKGGPLLPATVSDASSSIVSEEKIRRCGMTLDQARALAEALPTTQAAVAFFPAIDGGGGGGDATSAAAAAVGSLSGQAELRNLLVAVLSEPPSRQGLVLNYHMSTMGQTPFGGHLSPVAAYHEPSDSILVLDPWHTQTEPFWGSLCGVWKAMGGGANVAAGDGGSNDDGSVSSGSNNNNNNILDPESQKPRGLLKVVHHYHDHETVLPRLP